MSTATGSARAAFRPASLGNTPGDSTGRSPAGAGFGAYFRKCRSLAGVTQFHMAFSRIGMMTSLINGLPRRETWTQLPAVWIFPCFSWITDFFRLAAPQTPITELGDIGSVGVLPLRASSCFGTLI